MSDLLEFLIEETSCGATCNKSIVALKNGEKHNYRDSVEIVAEDGSLIVILSPLEDSPVPSSVIFNEKALDSPKEEDRVVLSLHDSVSVGFDILSGQLSRIFRHIFVYFARVKSEEELEVSSAL